MAPNKKVPINYSARDFESIKNQLIQHAKKYYPNQYKDFSEAGFGSFVMDTVAYTGDMLSFYLDYQANESFFDTANEFNNVLKLAKSTGYKFRENFSSQGIATFFILVPANTVGLGPDPRYIPKLKKGSVFSAKNGNDFTLLEDVFFNREENEIVVGQVNESTGLPTSYAIRAYGKIISGKTQESTYSVGSFTRFLKIPLGVPNVAEVLSVTDSEGHDYYEVDYLSQDVIYRPLINRTETNSQAAAILKPFSVPRRYVVERDATDVVLQFGYGTDSANVTTDKIVDPSNVVLQIYGRDYITDREFDPTNLISSDSFGIVPEDTTLSVLMRVNTTANVNAGVDTITKVTRPIFEFTDITALDSSLVSGVKTSLEITNEESILGDVSSPTTMELKRRVLNSFATQNRAVTQQDYETLIYQMPPMFGAIKRVKCVRDADSFKRNLNLYVVSEDSTGKLTTTNETVKQNIKTWLNKARMINDTIDILDAKIINYGINFEVVGELDKDKHDILTLCSTALAKEFSRLRDIGEPLFISDCFNILKQVKGVQDVVKVNIVLKTGGLYSDIKFSILENTSADGRWINVPMNCVMEMKYPSIDCKGSVR